MRRDGTGAPSADGLNALAGEHLHRVAFLDVVPAVQQDAALDALAALVDVVFSPAKRAHPPSQNRRPAPLKAPAVPPMDDAVGHVAPGDDPAPRLESGAD